MIVHNLIDVSPFGRATLVPRPEPALNRVDNTAAGRPQPDAAEAARVVREPHLVRELGPANVYPKHAVAIDTFLNIAHYTDGESIINTFA